MPRPARCSRHRIKIGSTSAQRASDRSVRYGFRGFTPPIYSTQSRETAGRRWPIFATEGTDRDQSPSDAL